MESHDLLTISATKATAYVVAVASLLLFVPFWRFLNRPASRQDGPTMRAEADGCRDRADVG